MSSNNPYGAQWDEGGSQPPMPGQGRNVGAGPGQQPSPYRYPQQPPAGYPQQPPAGYPQQPAAGSPSSASGYSFGPFAPEQQQTGWGGGSQPGQYGGPPRAYGPAPTRQAPEQPKNRTKILIIIGAAALAVILVAVAVIVATRDKPSADPQGGQNPGGQQSVAPQNTPRPSDAVSAYLQALAAGDATAALSYSADPAPTGPLLTNEVLAESRNRMELTGIDVPVVDDQNVKSVSATYTLGSSVVNESFDVVKVSGDLEAQPCRQGSRSCLHRGRAGSGQDQWSESHRGIGRCAAWLIRIYYRPAICRLWVQERCAGEESLCRRRHVQHPKPVDWRRKEGRHFSRQEELLQVPQGPFADSEELPAEVQVQVQLQQELDHLATRPAMTPSGNHGDFQRNARSGSGSDQPETVGELQLSGPIR